MSIACSQPALQLVMIVNKIAGQILCTGWLYPFFRKMLRAESLNKSGGLLLYFNMCCRSKVACCIQKNFIRHVHLDSGGRQAVVCFDGMLIFIYDLFAIAMF